LSRKYDFKIFDDYFEFIYLVFGIGFISLIAKLYDSLFFYFDFFGCNDKFLLN
jgi:hypothetical protein